LSKTKNVPRLTSEISSSLRLICGLGGVYGVKSDAGPTAPVPYAPPASAIDAPTTGTTFLKRFFVFCAMFANLPCFQLGEFRRWSAVLQLKLEGEREAGHGQF
jgi:hypothetical protein